MVTMRQTIKKISHLTLSKILVSQFSIHFYPKSNYIAKITAFSYYLLSILIFYHKKSQNQTYFPYTFSIYYAFLTYILYLFIFKLKPYHSHFFLKYKPLIYL